MSNIRYLIFIAGLMLTVSQASASLPQSCQPLDGEKSQNAVEVLFVMGDYKEDVRAEKHAMYYAGLEDTDRGLLDVFPMNVTKDRFEVLYVGARKGSNNIGGSNGPFREARYQRKQCGADYAVYMARDSHSWGTGAKDIVARVKGISDKVSEDNGAVGLIHEWGHIFGDVSDEYDRNSGKREGNYPNCARSRSQAEKWWGGMAETSDSVEYANGCKNSDDMIEPHPGGTIMGDGGLWNYGPVNDRNFLKNIAEETGPVTDIGISSVSKSGSDLEVQIEYEKASNVANLELENSKKSKKVFLHGSGTRKVNLQLEDQPSDVKATIDTVDDIKEVNAQNNDISRNFDAKADYWKGKFKKKSKELEESRQKVSKLQSRVSGLQSDLSSVRKDLKNAESLISSLRSRNTNLSKKINRTQQEKNTSNPGTEDPNISVKELKNNFSSRLKDVRDENSRLKSKIDSLESQLTSARQKINKLEQQETSVSKEVVNGSSQDENRSRNNSGSGEDTGRESDADVPDSEPNRSQSDDENRSKNNRGSVGNPLVGLLDSIF